MPISRKEQLDMNLQSTQPGHSIVLSTIRYQDYTADLTSESDVEVKRIVGFLKKNPGVRLEIGAFIDQVYTDSIPSNDLTEIIADTSFIRIAKPTPSLTEESFTDETLETSDSSQSELTFEEEMEDDPDSATVFNDIELEPKLSPVDSVLAIGYEVFEETEDELTFIKINYTYHNDRTQKQAEALMNKLIDAGVPTNLLEAKGYGDDWSEDYAREERNYWIELKILNR